MKGTKYETSAKNTQVLYSVHFRATVKTDQD